MGNKITQMKDFIYRCRRCGKTFKGGRSPSETTAMLVIKAMLGKEDIAMPAAWSLHGCADIVGTIGVGDLIGVEPVGNDPGSQQIGG